MWIEAEASKMAGMEEENGLGALVGKHIIYAYENGWEYEVYYKSEGVIDYRVRSGLVGGRAVNGQPVHMRRLAPAPSLSFMVTWTEPTGTCVTQVLDLAARSMDVVIFFPRWVVEHPLRISCFQNLHLPAICSFRDAGPTYPLHVVNEHGLIHTLLHRGPDNDLPV
jgi:phenolic acid decarboxylase